MSHITFEEALMAIPGAGPVMEVARDVSRVLRESGIDGAIIGGVAVVIHGHTRTTVDVDVFAPEAERLSEALQASGYQFDDQKREFIKDRVPVHLVPTSQIGVIPQKRMDIDGVRTVSLADLLNIKLRSGRENILRAKDLGDAIDLMRHHRLNKDFVARLDASVRPEFLQLIDAIEREAK